MSFGDWASNMWSDMSSASNRLWDKGVNAVSGFFGGGEPEYKPAPAVQIPSYTTQLRQDGPQDYAYDPLLTAQQVAKQEQNPNHVRDIARRGFDDAHGGEKHILEDYSDTDWDKYRSERDAYMDKFVGDDMNRREKEYAASPEGKAAKQAEEDRWRKAQEDEMARIRAQLTPVR